MKKQLIYCSILISLSFFAKAEVPKTNLFGYQLEQNVSNQLNDLFLTNSNTEDNSYQVENFKSDFFSKLNLITNMNNSITEIKASTYPNNFYIKPEQCFRVLKQKAYSLKKYYKEYDTDNLTYISFSNNLNAIKNLLNESDPNKITTDIKNINDTNVIRLSCDSNYSYNYDKNVFYISYELSNIKNEINSQPPQNNVKHPIDSLFGININKTYLNSITNLTPNEEQYHYSFIPTQQYSNIDKYELNVNPSTNKIEKIYGTSQPMSESQCFNLLKSGEQQIRNYYSDALFATSDIDMNHIIYSVFDNNNKTQLNISCKQIPKDIHYQYSISIESNK